jgi:hypothetical protein
VEAEVAVEVEVVTEVGWAAALVAAVSMGEAYAEASEGAAFMGAVLQAGASTPV